MSLTIIAAVSDNGVIGLEGKLPWNIPEDMTRFRDLTVGNSVIMGRKTYQSLPDRFRPLPNRKNIVLSYMFNSLEHIYVARTIEDALKLAGHKQTYVIGGETLYKQFLPLATNMEITKVHRDFKGDARFPEVNWDEWQLTNEKRILSELSKLHVSFLSYKRR